MIVRELIALFGIQLDRASVARADAAYGRVRDTVRQADRALAGANNQLRGARGHLLGVGEGAQGAALGVRELVRAFGGGLLLEGVRRGITGLLQLGSDAEETNNVLNEVFEGSAESVRAWASEMAGQLGRSEFTLRSFAATMGAMLLPMLNGNTEAAKEMSTTISALAVDLSSFFNTTEDEALTALRAGLSGESEPLRRFGVVLLDATLQEFALKEGITKRVQAMSVAEKTELRYQFILANTTKAQGDAMRTAGAYANSLRAVTDGFKDLGTRMGERLLPIGQRVLGWIKDGIVLLRGFMERTHAAEVALGVLATTAIVVAIALLAPFLPAIFAAAKFVAMLTLIALAVDDVITFFMGGKSALGELIDAMFGLGTSKRFLDDWNAGLNVMNETLKASVEWWAELFAGVDKFGELTFVQDWRTGLEELNAVLDAAIERWAQIWGWVDKVMSAGESVIAPLVKTVVGDTVPSIADAPRAPRLLPPRVFTRPITGNAASLAAPGTRGGNNVKQDVRANITIHADPRDRAGVESSTRDGLGRALEDAREALVTEVD